MSAALLATKTHIPPLRSNLVNRQHLIARLNDSLVHPLRLTLISAPAGYGKSTLLSEWVSQIGIPAAWLSLEAGENSPVLFWEYFISALSTIPHFQEAKIGASFSQALSSLKSPPIEELLINLLNELSKIDEPSVLVLDDVHVITDHQVHQDLAFFIDHLHISASGFRLVVASRMDPPWQLARWRAHNELNELRPSDLRFSYDETVQLLNQILNLGLSAHDIAALQDRTEGWIAGLQLAAISIQARMNTQGADSASQFIETFTGSNKFILDYLMDEVINQQPDEIREFLYGTAILDHLTAPLCDALLARNDSREILHQLEQANLFLIPLDEERQWYRYHHLMSELLHKHLKLMQPERIIELHERACDWFAERNYLSEAINHALDAGDIPVVHELVSGNALTMVEHAELYDVLRHFEAMPTQFISSKPWLAVAHAWVKAYADPLGGVEEILRQAEQALPGVWNSEDRQHLTSQIIAIRAYVAWVTGKSDQAVELSDLALACLPENDRTTRAHLLNIKGLALQYNYDLSGAQRSFDTAITAGKESGKLYNVYFALANLAYNNFMQGRLYKAFSLCQSVIDLANRSSQVSLRMPVLAYAYATLSLVQREWNKLNEAVLNARKSVSLAEQWNQADTLHFTLTSLARCLFAAGEIDEAFSISQRAMRLARDVSPWFFWISACDEIEFNLLKGDVRIAAQWFANLEQSLNGSPKKGRYQVVRAALLNAQGRFSESLDEMERSIPLFEQGEVILFVMYLLPLQALALRALNREDQALSVIDHCLALARPEGFVRIFIDQGLPMQKLLQIALQRGIESDHVAELLTAFLSPLTDQVIATSIGDQSLSVMVNCGLIEPLSQREIQVLHLLNSPLTNEEIGHELYVSVNTIRTHVRNIYRKLGVSRRVEAVLRAKELKLI